MRALKSSFVFILLFISVTTSAQLNQYIGTPGTTVINKGQFRTDSSLYIPQDTIMRAGWSRTLPALGRKGDSLYMWSVAGQRWILTGSASGFIQNQYAAAQTANAWIDSMKAARLFLTDRLNGSLSGQSHIYMPFTAATSRANVGIHFHNLPLWDTLENDDIVHGYLDGASPFTGQNSGGSLTSTRIFAENRGDSSRLDYSQQIAAFFRYNFDPSINAYGLVGGRKEYYLHMPGFNSNNQYFNNGGDIVMRAGQFGNNGANYVATLGMFNSGGSFTVLGDDIVQYFADVDLQRVLTTNKKTFNGSISQFHSEIKFQQGAWLQNKQNYARRINAVHVGAPDDMNTASYGWAVNKDTILNSSQIDTINGVYIEPLRTLKNETKNGFGIFQSGQYDVNVFAGKNYLTGAGATPNFANSDTTSARLIVKGRAWMDSTSTGVLTGTSGSFTGTVSANILSATATISAGGSGTLSGGFYDYVKNGGWASFGANSSGLKLTLGGYRASQWQGVELYASATKILDVTATGAAITGNLSADGNINGGSLSIGTTSTAYKGQIVNTGGALGLKITTVTPSTNNPGLSLRDSNTGMESFLTPSGSNHLAVGNYTDHPVKFYQNNAVTATISSTAVTLNSVLVLPTSSDPTSSADAAGVDGEVRKGTTAGTIFVKYGSTWYKFTGVTF